LYVLFISPGQGGQKSMDSGTRGIDGGVVFHTLKNMFFQCS
jgi:hypothetical protein